MTAYYNEFDPYAAAWLRELIDLDQIAPGYVDERSIVDIQPSDLDGFTQCHFFAGIGVWSYALRQAGWPDDKPVWTGSCPCQPFSTAGNKEGTDDDRHLFPTWFELIQERRPECIFGEQVASADVIGKVKGDDREVWLDAVQANLESASYAVGSLVIPACGVGAPHIRQRSWFVAHSISQGLQGYGRSGKKQVSEGRQREEGYSAEGGSISRLGNTSSQPSERNLGELPEAQAEATTEGCSDGGFCDGYSDASKVGELGNPQGERLGEEGAASSGHSKRTPHAGSDDRADSYNSFWRYSDWLGCRDGKFRPVEPGTFPLVDGTSGSVGQGSDISLSDVKSTKEARTMRLKGYGNAIVAPLAAEFIQAYMEIET